MISETGNGPSAANRLGSDGRPLSGGRCAIFHSGIEREEAHVRVRTVTSGASDPVSKRRRLSASRPWVFSGFVFSSSCRSSRLRAVEKPNRVATCSWYSQSS
jgi:hypothetical protein